MGVILEKVKCLSKIEYEKRVGDNIWLAAWFDGNVKADAKTFFDYKKLANEFVTVKKEIRELAMNGRRKSITFIGDKSSTTVSDVPTFHLSVPTPIIIVDVIAKKKPKQKRAKHLHGKILGKEITDFVRVTKVLPGLARCPEKELAQIQIIHRSKPIL